MSGRTFNYDTVDPEQAQWLSNRPWWTRQHTKLNNKLRALYPDTHLVAPDYKVNIPKLLRFGFFQDGSKSELQPMDDGRCHDNVKLCYTLGLVDRVVTGFALSEDGLWRAHSWGLGSAGQPIETTEPRILYYGMIEK